MTRKIVTIENRKTPQNQIILPNALTMPNKPVPVYVHGALTKVVGQARSFERDLDGMITADVILTDTEYEKYFCAIDIQDADIQMRDGVLNVLSGSIVGVDVIPYWFWGEAHPFLPGDPFNENSSQKS